MALRTAQSPPVGSTQTLAFRVNQGGPQWPQVPRCLYSPNPASALLLVANAGRWHQVVHLNLPRVPNAPNSLTTYSSYCASHQWLVSQGPPRHNGDALVCQLSVYCSSSLCIDHLPRVADVAFWEHLRPYFLYFWIYCLSLGHFGWDCYWQQPSLCSHSWYPCWPIQYTAYTVAQKVSQCLHVFH